MSEKQNRESVVWYKQKAVIEFLTSDEKSKKVREHIKVVYGENIFDVIMIRYWASGTRKKS